MATHRLPPETRAQLAALLQDCPAFIGVSEWELEQLVLESESAYVAGPVRVADGYETFVVHSGAVVVRDAGGETVDLVGRGDYAAPHSSARLEPVEPSLLLVLPRRSTALAWSAPPEQIRALIHGRAGQATDAVDFENAAVSTIMSSPVHTIDPSASCRQAAVRMREHGISALVVTGSDEPAIMTDRDLRNRSVAAGLSPDLAVDHIASRPLKTIESAATVVEAVAAMVASAVHHLVVEEHGRMVGMITASDVLRLRQSHPLLFRASMESADSVAAVAEVMSQIPAAAGALLAAGVRARVVARLLAALTDRLTLRLLTLAEGDCGKPPAPFGWVALGSHGRREQTLFSDQDHALLLTDGLDDDGHEWFERLAMWMVDAFERCGYPRCPGGVMATSPSWRAEVSVWRQHVEDWIYMPSSEHLLGSGIGFDQRTVAGTLDARDLLGPAVSSAARNELFLAHLARDAVRHRPPLGFLGRILVKRSGEHAGTLNIKSSVMVPIASLARVHALAGGTGEMETVSRLDAAATQGRLSVELANLLSEGYELAMHLRLNAHVRQHQDGLPPSNRVDPGDLSALVRAQMKETFKAVLAAQEALGRRYRVSSLG